MLKAFYDLKLFSTVMLFITVVGLLFLPLFAAEFTVHM